jgi:hypothetical protein
MQDAAADNALTSYTTLQGQLITRKAVGLTAAKFKSLVLLMRGFSSSNTMYFWVYMVYYYYYYLTANGFSPGGSGTTIRQQTNNTY